MTVQVDGQIGGQIGGQVAVPKRVEGEQRQVGRREAVKE